MAKFWTCFVFFKFKIRPMDILAISDTFCIIAMKKQILPMELLVYVKNSSNTLWATFAHGQILVYFEAVKKMEIWNELGKLLMIHILNINLPKSCSNPLEWNKTLVWTVLCREKIWFYFHKSSLDYYIHIFSASSYIHRW